MIRIDFSNKTLEEVNQLVTSNLTKQTSLRLTISGGKFTTPRQELEYRDELKKLETELRFLCVAKDIKTKQKTFKKESFLNN